MQRKTSSLVIAGVKGFTLVEVLIGFAIFTVVIGLVMASVTGAFRSVGQAQKMLAREQRQRLLVFRLTKEASSLTWILYPQRSFQADEHSFFLYSPERIV